MRGLVVAGLFVAASIPGKQMAAQGGIATTNNSYCSEFEASSQTVFNAGMQRTCTATGTGSPARYGTASTTASAVNGVLRASASIDPSSIPDGKFSYGGPAVGFAQWNEKLRVSGGSSIAAFARLFWTWNGRLESPGPNTSAAAYFDLRSGINAIEKAYTVGNGQYLSVAETYSLLVPLQGFNDGYGADFLMRLVVNVGHGGTNAGLGVSAMFGNSGGISGVELLDNRNQVITDATYGFLNGLQLYRPTTVPEPATLALVVPGLLGSVFLRRRRRLRTDA